MLLVLAKDLLADHRAPDEYESADYGPMQEPRAVLRTHLDHLATALDDATTAEALSAARAQLVRFSPLMGDDVYLDRTYGMPLAATDAAPGSYHVEVVVDGTAVRGTLTVRDDPMR
jgi:hypothetical protein